MSEEEWTSSTSSEPFTVPLGGRIELLGITIGIGDTAALVDPDDGQPDRQAGVESIPMAVLDITGHLHFGGQCIPSQTPFLVTPTALDEVIEGLCEARDALDARYPHRERRSPQ